MLTRSFAQTFSKLALHVRKHFGAEIRFVEISELSKFDGTILAQLETGSNVVINDKIYMPLIHNQFFMGATEISHVDLNKVSTQRLDDTIRLLLESKAEGMDQIDFLREMENVTCDSDEQRRQDGNVIVMNSFRKNEFELREITKVDITRLNFPFVIECQSGVDTYSEAHKMAFEIHYQSGRFAFMTIDDLSWDEIKCAADFNSLGAVTVFIPNFMRLSFARQTLLLDYMNSPRTKDSPQIVAAIALPISQVKASERIIGGLVDALMVGYICMTEPFETYRGTDWVEFFFDSLQRRSQLDV